MNDLAKLAATLVFKTELLLTSVIVTGILIFDPFNLPVKLGITFLTPEQKGYIGILFLFSSMSLLVKLIIRMFTWVRMRKGNNDFQGLY